ncbi:O-6-methylguanine DNA methyltransferase [Tenacibaculum adriaticum]|uniref:methylated-DNA--[protein]-cysteine S-methyltransferase n=1 Tax=Tenacibaculum adriaticum TaxID=413713 RepID=A0A5S5DTA0_9FLAO|nr:MGMT family protein [Tenacibaculum adriaticum]TYP99121.1 O-6-methylguanine DNA methyltransferase [Tenacibaculum adriaticum]
MENTYHFDTIAKAIYFIKNHHIEQPTLEEIANHVHLSKFHFQRLFKKWVGISPKEYLQFITIEKAKESLRKGQSTLEASYNVGLSGNSRLHDLFIKIEACTPGQFKQKGKGLQIYVGEIGTPFQLQVWKALLQIPSSYLLAYHDIAKMIDNPRAVRAVGTAIGKNPIAYLIPCHRVIKSDGNIGNYRWNSERKITINSYETIQLK